MTKAVLAMTDRRIKTLLEITELSRKMPKLASKIAGRFERVGTNDSTASEQFCLFYQHRLPYMTILAVTAQSGVAANIISEV